MQNEILPEPGNNPQTIQTEADAQAARLVTQRLNEITRRAKRAKRRAKVGSRIVLYVLAAVGYLLSLWFNSRKIFPSFFPIFVFVALLVPIALETFGTWWGAPKFDAEEIAQTGGVRAIMPLFAALENPLPEKEGQAIRNALTTLLPQMKASDAHLLTREARLFLHAWVSSALTVGTRFSDRDALRLAALKALEQVGDSSAIPVVERLANCAPQTPREERIRQAAIECLPMLRANCGEVETARTLLRASQSEDARPDTLLRPASGSGQTGSAELLRGSDSPDAAE